MIEATSAAAANRRAKHFGGGNLRLRSTCGSVLASGGRGRVEGDAPPQISIAALDLARRY